MIGTSDLNIDEERLDITVWKHMTLVAKDLGFVLHMLVWGEKSMVITLLITI